VSHLSRFMYVREGGGGGGVVLVALHGVRVLEDASKAFMRASRSEFAIAISAFRRSMSSAISELVISFFVGS
jgi:hypothetical protein